MAEHELFTRDEATNTPQGRTRGVILDQIAMRCGQVPDIHPRLLEGIEAAARILAQHDAALAAENERLRRKVARVEALADEWERLAEIADIGAFAKRERWVRAIRARVGELRAAVRDQP